MAEIARRTTDKGNRFLFFVHRKELVDQIKTTFTEQNVDMSLGQIGMVQTFTRHIDKLKKPAVIFVDEAHHALATSYQRILNHFPEAIKLMFTATPIRLDGKGFDAIADDLIPGKTIDWLIDNGYMADFDYYNPPSKVDNSKLKKSHGDYTNKSIDESMDKTIYGDTIEQYLKHAKGMQAIVYTYSVESAKKIADKFRQAGYSAAEVDGSTPKEIREQRVQDFKSGKLTILSNVELFLEGLDLPNVDCVIQMRPTASTALYMQFAMRSLNPRPNKRAVIIDQVGNANRFGLPSIKRKWTLKARKKSKDKEKLPPIITCPYCFFTGYKKDFDNFICPSCGETLPKPQQEAFQVDSTVQLEKLTRQNSSFIKKTAEMLMKNNIAKNIAGKNWYQLDPYNYKQFEVKAEMQEKSKAYAWTIFQIVRKKRGIK